MERVVELYNTGMSLRQIGNELGWSHHRVKRALIKSGIDPLIQRIKTPLTEKQLEVCSKNGSLWKGRKRGELSIDRRFNLILKKSGISLKQSDFPDIDRLLYLTYYTSKHKANIEDREAFLSKFYADKIFVALYDQWVASGQNKWLAPSLDHKKPLSRGGSYALENLHFMTWFENRAKADMTMEEWVEFCTKYEVNAKIFNQR